MRIWTSLLFCSILFACGAKKPEAPPAETPAPKPDYYYFPKANVYFDSANKDYLFLANDSNSWVTEKRIPAVMLAMMDKSVRIDSPAQPVWKDNQNHRLIYSAVLYASPTDTVETKVEKPVAKVDSVVEKKEEKKGVKGFFSKLFGRKKKDADKQD